MKGVDPMEKKEKAGILYRMGALLVFVILVMFWGIPKEEDVNEEKDFR